MTKIIGIIRQEGGENIVIDLKSGKNITNLFRTEMIDLAAESNQALEFNEETNRSRRIELSSIPAEETIDVPKANVKNDDPVLAFIKDAPSIKPSNLEMSDIKWKYLVRSVIRGKNIMMVGPAGCGKTQAAKSLPEAMKNPFFYFNLGATQDPRSTLIGNTHFKEGETIFDKSPFVKAIETENAIILLDELSRAHPEAWNILMTVLDEGQRYLRLDESVNAPIIKVANGVSFIATANIGTEYTSTRVLDRALMDRFEIIEVDILSLEQESILLAKRFPEIDPTLINSVADIADINQKRMEIRRR
jgi:MoxR-like ATPase